MNYEETERINTIKEAFQIYDKDNDGYISYEELVSIVRAMSHNPTEKDLSDNIPDTNKRYDFPEFFDIMNKFKKVHSLENVLDDAKLFDREGTGLLSSNDVYHIMTNTSGEKLSNDDIREIIKTLEKNGMININELVKYMYN